MKKHIYTTIALVVTAIGCTKSNFVDVPMGQDTAIALEIYNGKVPVTKAEDVTTEILKEYEYSEDADGNPNAPAAFHVKAFNGSIPYMERDVWYQPEVTEGDQTTAAYWHYGSTMYWPASGSLSFVAYGLNADKDLGTAEAPNKTIVWDGDSKTQFVYKVPSTASDQEDLIVALPVNNATASTGKVSLTFKHLLSRIGFKLETIGEGTSVTINNITFHGTFKNTATVNLTASNATTDPMLTANASPTAASYTLFSNGQSFQTSNASENSQSTTTVDGKVITTYNIYNTNGTDESDRYMMIIPGKPGYLPENEGVKDEYNLDGNNDTNMIIPYILVDYTLGESNETAKLPLLENVSTTADPVWQVWEFKAGKAYEFIFKVSISAIEFTGNVVGWDVDHDGKENEDSDKDGNPKEDDNIDL